MSLRRLEPPSDSIAEGNGRDEREANMKSEPRKEPGGCRCPYCDQEMAIASLPFCQSCHIMVRYCLVCKIPLPKDATKCPNCGGRVSE